MDTRVNPSNESLWHFNCMISVTFARITVGVLVPGSLNVQKKDNVAGLGCRRLQDASTSVSSATCDKSTYLSACNFSIAQSWSQAPLRQHQSSFPGSVLTISSIASWFNLEDPAWSPPGSPGQPAELVGLTVLHNNYAELSACADTRCGLCKYLRREICYYTEDGSTYVYDEEELQHLENSVILKMFWYREYGQRYPRIYLGDQRASERLGDNCNWLANGCTSAAQSTKNALVGVELGPLMPSFQRGY
ncbi:hypothetical protein MBLNU457_g0782t1 [Dothideomycetes sp. NU457]